MSKVDLGESMNRNGVSVKSEFRAEMTKYGRNQYLSMRIYQNYDREKPDEMLPTKKGMNLNVEDMMPVLKAVIDTLEIDDILELEEHMQERLEILGLNE